MHKELDNVTDVEPYHDPMVKITIAGLGLLWFDAEDEKNEVAEFGFVEVPDNDHPLYILICDDQGTSPIPILLNKGDKIEIIGQSGNRGMGNRYQKDIKPVTDFKWLVDLDEIHNPHLDFKSSPDFYARLRINIEDAIFYTASRSSSNGEVSDLSTGLQVRPPQLIGIDIGVVTEKDATELRINGGENLLSNPTAKYKITIRYKCEERQGLFPSDFQHIYNVLDTTEKYDLTYDQYERPYLTDCEFSLIKNFLNNVPDFISKSDKLSSEDNFLLDYLKKIVSCEVICQSAVFAKYSRTVGW